MARHRGPTLSAGALVARADHHDHLGDHELRPDREEGMRLVKRLVRFVGDTRRGYGPLGNQRKERGPALRRGRRAPGSGEPRLSEAARFRHEGGGSLDRPSDAGHLWTGRSLIAFLGSISTTGRRGVHPDRPPCRAESARSIERRLNWHAGAMIMGTLASAAASRSAYLAIPATISFAALWRCRTPVCAARGSGVGVANSLTGSPHQAFWPHNRLRSLSLRPRPTA